MTGSFSWYSLILPVVLLGSTTIAEDDYLAESRNQCKHSRGLLSCSKYQMLEMVDRWVDLPESERNGTLVRIARVEEQEDEMFSGARQLEGDSEMRKMAKFVLRKLNKVLATRAIAVALPEGVKVVGQEDRMGKQMEQQGGMLRFYL